MIETIKFRECTEEGVPTGEAIEFTPDFQPYNGGEAAGECASYLAYTGDIKEGASMAWLEIMEPEDFAGFYEINIGWQPTFDVDTFEPEVSK